MLLLQDGGALFLQDATAELYECMLTGNSADVCRSLNLFVPCFRVPSPPPARSNLFELRLLQSRIIESAFFASDNRRSIVPQ